MATYVLIDALNLFHRAKWSARGDINLRTGMCLHVVFSSIRKAHRDLGADHVVLCLDSRSWRRDLFEPYKRNRAVERAKLTAREQEDESILMETFDSLCEFVRTKTNATVLHCEGAEADDLIATWIDLHPDDQHVIVSSDGDFVQLVSPQVSIYNGVTETLLTHQAAFDERGRRRAFEMQTSGKVKIGEPDEQFEAEPGWQDLALFVKCVRGDRGDNVFPAYPGARFRGTRNRVGIVEAYEDRSRGGYNWNNFMLQTWQDDQGQTRTVKDQYELNRQLVDLQAQPEQLRQQFQQCVAQCAARDPVSNVGIHLLKFCAEWELNNIGRYPDDYAAVLNARYTGPLQETQ